jgi:hypothetical protein
MDAVFGIILLGVSLPLFVAFGLFHDALSEHWAPPLVWVVYVLVFVAWGATWAGACSLLHIDLTY